MDPHFRINCRDKSSQVFQHFEMSVRTRMRALQHVVPPLSEAKSSALQKSSVQLCSFFLLQRDFITMWMAPSADSIASRSWPHCWFGCKKLAGSALTFFVQPSLLSPCQFKLIVKHSPRADERFSVSRSISWCSVLIKHIFPSWTSILQSLQ